MLWFTAVMDRMRCDKRTRDYVQRRTAEGMTRRENMRCPKRYVARELLPLIREALQANPPNEDLCVSCGEHIRNKDRVGCPLGVDDAEQLDRVLALQAEHGVAILHRLSYAGFRTLEELNQRA